MPKRRARVSRFTADEVDDLILKLQAVLPANSGSRLDMRASGGATASNVLKKTSRYIRKLHKEVDNLSDTLSQLLASGNITDADADILRRLLKP